MDYDADIVPEPEAWLALDHADRIATVSRAHVGRFPDALHSEGANELMHASLHAIVETQIASGEPALTGATVRRLHKDGLKRHAAVHAVMQVLAEHLGRMREDKPFDQGAYAAGLARSGVPGFRRGRLPRVLEEGACPGSSCPPSPSP